MATSPNAVRVRLYRARKQLESRLAAPADAEQTPTQLCDLVRQL